MKSYIGRPGKFLVEIPVPPGWNKKEVADYIRSAVRMWSKSMNPEDPMWDASDKATVKIVK